MLSLLIFVLISDSAVIHTTVADSSHVAFIAQTPLSWTTVEHDRLRYIRFSDSPLSDSIGYPELPMITCFVALPDNVTPGIEFAFSSETTQSVVPVYPAPAHVISYEYTPAVVDSFVQNSTAYLSDEFWPSERVRIIGETRICDQRLLQVQLFPAQYRASDSTLSTVTNFSVSISFDGASAVWSPTGLGHFQSMVNNSPIVGYNPVEQTYAPVPTYFGQVDPETGPSRVPDYVIICASGLYTQCATAIDALANHRVSLNDFDVALVTTDDILSDFGDGATVITDNILRSFTEHMWNEWGVASSNKKPEYLLLIGDHEDQEYSNEPWFLPTHLYPVNQEPPFYYIGNDEWYSYFNQPTTVNNAFPDMKVGRLAVKNAGSQESDTLSALIYNLIDIEDPITQAPVIDYRRRIVRLAGAGRSRKGVYHQDFGIDNRPHTEWTEGISDWMEYDYSDFYCGDGRSFTDSDMSHMKSVEWVTHCIEELNKGAGVIFYTDHGEFHMFSAGLEWCPWFIWDDRRTLGARNSTFNNYQIENYLNDPVTNYSAPFLLSLSCLNGTFNHTLAEHDGRTSHPEFCFDDGSDTIPLPAYDFGTDCIAERLLKNTAVPVAGVFAGSEVSYMSCYEYYGKGILEAIYTRGYGRLGDAVAAARLQYRDNFISSTGANPHELGQFNLLGDPALDISDRVRFPDRCDLLVYPGGVTISEYPVEGSSGNTLPLTFTVYNNGGEDSGNFTTRITFRNGLNSETINVSCASVDFGTHKEYQYSWPCCSWLVPPVELEVSFEVLSPQSPTDSWMGNNTASLTVQLNDTYPFEGNWPISVEGIVQSTPMLVNLDLDLLLEIVVLNGNSLTAFEHNGVHKWEIDSQGFIGGQQPLAVDLDNDGFSEFLLAYTDGIKVVDHDGSVMQSIVTTGHLFTVGDMLSSTTELELCVATEPGTLTLYKWNGIRDEFVDEAVWRFTVPDFSSSVSISCADLIGTNTNDDVVFCNSSPSLLPDPPQSMLIVFDWESVGSPFIKTWQGDEIEINPAAGALAETRMVGYPFRSYEYTTSGDYPASIIEPGGTAEYNCAIGTADASKLIYGVFADWLTTPLGADAFVLPSEMQCFAWNKEGDPLTGWATALYSGATLGSSISPTALGDLDDDTVADVLFSTIEKLFAYGSDGFALDAFPIALPDDVSAHGGFAIADIDNDGNVEIVFGTSDGLLHCWELDSCTTGYAPWTQFQHDYGRTGVLE